MDEIFDFEAGSDKIDLAALTGGCDGGQLIWNGVAGPIEGGVWHVPAEDGTADGLPMQVAIIDGNPGMITIIFQDTDDMVQMTTI